MLNRRSLRIKVAQNLYAYNQCKLANYEIALKQIEEHFLQESFSGEGQNRAELKQNGLQAKEAFKQRLEKNKTTNNQVTPETIREAVDEVFVSYQNSLKKDMRLLRGNMVIEAEKVVDRYLMVLLLLTEFAEMAAGKYFKNPAKFVCKNLQDNRVIRAINTDESLQNLMIRKNISWKNYHQDIRTWYKEIINEAPEYATYKTLKDISIEEDRKILTFIVKNQIFKSDVINALFEGLDLSWEENKAVVKSMVQKTIKSVEENSNGELNLEISPLSYNWEDDKAFFEELFVSSIEKDEDFEKLVAEKSKNWDIHRLAMMDKIILKMAICEMIKFPSIPIKVTINEYIEISKRYSTPKSKQFVNGLLDSLANKLVSEGVIKKSGRGLIDNK